MWIKRENNKYINLDAMSQILMYSRGVDLISGNTCTYIGAEQEPEIFERIKTYLEQRTKVHSDADHVGDDERDKLSGKQS